MNLGIPVKARGEFIGQDNPQGPYPREVGPLLGSMEERIGQHFMLNSQVCLFVSVEPRPQNPRRRS